MKTIEVTDKIAKTIAALRNEDGEELNLNRETLCKAFSDLADILIVGDHRVAGAMSLLSEYHKLIEELSVEKD